MGTEVGGEWKGNRKFNLQSIDGSNLKVRLGLTGGWVNQDQILRIPSLLSLGYELQVTIRSQRKHFIN